MAILSFFLKHGDKNPSLIMARFSMNYYEKDDNNNKVYKSLRFSTGEKIDPKFWDQEKQRAMQTNKYPQYPELNQRLKDFETAIMNVYRKMLNDSEVVDITTLKNKLNTYLGRNNKLVKSVDHPTGFVSFIKTIIEDSKTGKRTTKDGRLLKSCTLICYNNTLNNIIKYQNELNKTLKFSDITMSFYHDFIQFMNNKGFSPNNIGKHIKNIKVFMNLATKRKLNDNFEYKDEDFKKISEEVQTIYLTEKDISKIYELDLSDDKDLEAVRDIFVIDCYTGLRYADLRKLSIDNIKDNTFIQIETQKTGENVIIPTHWRIKETLTKYNNCLPKVFSNAQMNEDLKTIGRMAKIKDVLLIKKTQGGIRTEKKFMKHELITVHTARRTFATNAYKAGIPTLSIMKITGHKTEKAFLRYIKVDKEENAAILANHPFFLL
ncbi:MAG TPA: phage integrase SAM-like domain-containing protein [Bacteroidales bacterium]|nr:phage integrase SAM-like domain-containing protein [Bacteroidales bacterium]